ncbi:putative alpha-ketoglutarate-dependent sulfonate dioxygenase [Mollisia scopiformis]|uniref:Putative alpha-ketoglutarate-dependent sulfonate dioxygenase n=1 Tax=Mollisia scopiformis TaxID=149040 RepID=A0A194X7V4_MOLSC|nr:putative alpha-ketoglutarate-dependent sulfonate dioxygenase [Mollisia scopiformis]KUJ16243.1 putative alpha-ketoglutarate-dependent sulfonate dioxygenase [Mollisia scopiformis]
MSPAAIAVPVKANQTTKVPTGQLSGAFLDLAPIDYGLEAEKEGKDGVAPAKYPHYLPTWPNVKWAPLEPFHHCDPGLDTDPSYPELLATGVKSLDLTPSIGTEIQGIQLSKLTPAGKDQLSRFVAERKVVVFRDQDLADLPIGDAVNFVRYFGRPHLHPLSGAPKGHPEVHLVHKAAGDKTAEQFFKTKISSVLWHTDVSYERQPPGTTFLMMLDGPSSGGDTLYVNTAEAYNRLSEGFKERLHGLKALHSGFDQASAHLRKGGIIRREPIMSEHPVVRTHPVTGEKSLYVNPQFTRSIVGYKQEESDALLKFLYDHIAYGSDFQMRARWEEKTVVVWDNRVTLHSALLDWKAGARRHLARIAAQAEAPFETPYVG